MLKFSELETCLLLLHRSKADETGISLLDRLLKKIGIERFANDKTCLPSASLIPKVLKTPTQPKKKALTPVKKFREFAHCGRYSRIAAHDLRNVCITDRAGALQMI